MSSDRDVAESLLRFMRDPVSLIDRVTESCELGDGEMHRDVRVRVKPDVLGEGDHLYLDVLQVERGEYVELEIDEGDTVRKLTHNEHQRVSAFLISTRFLTVWASVKVDGSVQAEFDAAMEVAHKQLQRLPLLRSTRAEALLGRHFDSTSRTLTALLDYPGAVVDPELMFGLYRLCKRLVWKYLALVRIDGTKSGTPELAYSYWQEVAEIDLFEEEDEKPDEVHAPAKRKRGAKRRGKEEPSERPSLWVRAKRAVGRKWRAFVRKLRRRIDPTSRPGSFRIHVGWAKRTNHYTFSIASAEGHFISRQGLLRASSDGQVSLVRRDEKQIKWSINTGQGRRVALFVSDARAVQDRLFIGVQNLELPGGSTSRVFRLTWLVLAGLIPFTTLALVATGPFIEVAGVIFALLAVGAFATTPPRGNGVLGFPLTSRVAPSLLATMLVWFIVWLVSRQLVPNGWVASFPAALDWLRPIWAVWGWFGWLPVVSGCIVLLRYLHTRRRMLRENYQRALSVTHIVSRNFK